MKKQTSTHYFSAFTQCLFDSSRRPRLESSWSSFFLKSLKKKKYPSALFIFFSLFRNMIFFSFLPSFSSFALCLGEVEEGILSSADTGEERRHFIKSCTGEMFEMAFTRAIYSRFSHLVCLSFSRSMFSQTPTLLSVQNSLSWRKTRSRNMKPPHSSKPFSILFYSLFYLSMHKNHVCV